MHSAVFCFGHMIGGTVTSFNGHGEKLVKTVFVKGSCESFQFLLRGSILVLGRQIYKLKVKIEIPDWVFAAPSYGLCIQVYLIRYFVIVRMKKANVIKCIFVFIKTFIHCTSIGSSERTTKSYLSKYHRAWILQSAMHCRRCLLNLHATLKITSINVSTMYLHRNKPMKKQSHGNA